VIASAGCQQDQKNEQLSEVKDLIHFPNQYYHWLCRVPSFLSQGKSLLLVFEVKVYPNYLGLDRCLDEVRMFKVTRMDEGLMLLKPH